MPRFDDSEFDPQTYGSWGEGLLKAFQGLMPSQPAVPEQGNAAGPGFDIRSEVNPQAALIDRMRGLQQEQGGYSGQQQRLGWARGLNAPSGATGASAPPSFDSTARKGIAGPQVSKPVAAGDSHLAPSALTERFVGAESSGNPNAKNPRSSATGLGQFIDGTWLELMARYHPEIRGSREELLALRNNPDLSREMTEAYLHENGRQLQRWGLPTTPGNLYLAHFAGAGGARSVLTADPATPLDQLLKPSAMKANPFLAGKTAGYLRDWAEKRVSGRHTGGTSAPQPTNTSPVDQESERPSAQSAQDGRSVRTLVSRPAYW
ncbi:transglycosylase SLT domain-containing protein [Bradyrhizobium oligotrophicum]|uniref:transglycosylase SLT domain-containing protein n=1 Tax=Bradyrhizobium oligotrophicum TaxID=44255 RepID=UPI003EBE702F